MGKLLTSRQLKARIKERHRDYYVLKGDKVTDKKGYDLAIFLAQQREKLEKKFPMIKRK